MQTQKSIHAQAIKTDIYRQPESLLSFLEKHLTSFSLEGKILAVTSKIVSLSENRIVASSSITKQELVKKEADHYLCEGGFGVELTIKHGILIPSAGIDESNSESQSYILFPENPYLSAQRIGERLKKTFQLENFGIILTDSHTMPLRRGVTGISLAHWGFRAVHSLIGQPDIFNHKLKFTHVDVADSLAAMAVLVMGEADECTPLALLTGAKIEFTEESSEKEIRIEPEADLYYPLLAPYLKSQGHEP